MAETQIDLSKLSEPFDPEDIEWRVSRAGVGPNGIYCCVLCYITARAVQNRLDEVCGPENWRNEEPKVINVNDKPGFVAGISIRIDGEWVTKWDVSEPTQIEPIKGGFSGAIKRAGAEWGIGRFLYALDETFAETAERVERGAKGWNYAKLPQSQGGGVYYWKTPALPGWALPKDRPITQSQLLDVKLAWKAKFAPDSKSPKEMAEGFKRFVVSVVGDFPVSEPSFWTYDAYEKCMEVISKTSDASGISSTVPFDE